MWEFNGRLKKLVLVLVHWGKKKARLNEWINTQSVLLKYLKSYCSLHLLYNTFLVFMIIRSRNNRLEAIHGSFRLGCREDFVRMAKYKRLPAEAMESPLLGNILGQNRQASIRIDIDIPDSALAWEDELNDLSRSFPVIWWHKQSNTVQKRRKE